MTRKAILVVDDTETVLMSEKMMLRGTGFEIWMARNGLQVLKTLEDKIPDLILLDIQMPELNGIETCRRIRENPATREIPIVMVTTRGEPEMVEESFMAGCNDYLTKPINKLELLAKVKNFLG
ncbi:response regulator [Myxococcota bacterium]|nr:response regulator [Myxococcota bacterium]